MTIIPADIDFECFIGGTWTQPFTFYDDTAETIPHNFTGWTPKFEVILYNGAVLTGTATVTSNTITAKLTSDQTTGVSEQQADYALSESEDGTNPLHVEYLAHGSLIFKKP